MKRILWTLLFTALGFAGLDVRVEAYEVATHDYINQAAFNHAENVGLVLEGQLRIPLDKKFNRFTARELVGLGGVFEDNGFRYFNHFHNPLAPDWQDAGLYLPILGQYTSSLLWAQSQTGEDWSWGVARQLYYDALTANDSDARDQAFYNMFLGLGRVMHLIADASVPAHTRNDPHIGFLSSNYETWALSMDVLTIQAVNPIFPIMPLDTSVNGLVPITAFWDTDQYNGTAPLTGTDIGVAEYSNANFVSDDTIFTEQIDPRDSQYFPFPTRLHAVLWDDVQDQTDANGQIKQITRQYLQKTGEGETVNHFVAVSWFYWYRLRYFPQYDQYLPVGLDEACYAEQAQFLVPRAVGYSAALLDYFFRGDLDAQADGSDGIKITNKSTEIMDGDFELYYDAVDPVTGEESRKRAGGPWPITLTPGVQSNQQDFTTPTDANESGRYLLVFRGQLGAEQDAVIGKTITLSPFKTVVYTFIQEQIGLILTSQEEDFCCDSGTAVGWNTRVSMREVRYQPSLKVFVYFTTRDLGDDRRIVNQLTTQIIKRLSSQEIERYLNLQYKNVQYVRDYYSVDATRLCDTYGDSLCREEDSGKTFYPFHIELRRIESATIPVIFSNADNRLFDASLVRMAQNDHSWLTFFRNNRNSPIKYPQEGDLLFVADAQPLSSSHFNLNYQYEASGYTSGDLEDYCETEYTEEQILAVSSLLVSGVTEPTMWGGAANFYFLDDQGGFLSLLGQWYTSDFLD